MNKKTYVDMSSISDGWTFEEIDLNKYSIIIANLQEQIKKLQQENQQLKKQKDDVVEYIKNENEWVKNRDYKLLKTDVLLRMLGEIDVED